MKVPVRFSGACLDAAVHCPVAGQRSRSRAFDGVDDQAPAPCHHRPGGRVLPDPAVATTARPPRIGRRGSGGDRGTSVPRRWLPRGAREQATPITPPRSETIQESRRRAARLGVIAVPRHIAAPELRRRQRATATRFACSCATCRTRTRKALAIAQQLSTSTRPSSPRFLDHLGAVTGATGSGAAMRRSPRCDRSTGMPRSGTPCRSRSPSACCAIPAKLVTTVEAFVLSG